MIIVEGPDGSGKSTLAARLALKFKNEVFHSGGPIKDSKELSDRISIQLNQWGNIVDRCSIFSEPAYGLVLRGKSLLGLHTFDMCIKNLVWKNWGVIYCSGKWPIEGGKLWKSEDHMKGIIVNHDDIRNMYKTLMNRAVELGLPIVQVNTEYLAKQKTPYAFNRMAWMADRRPSDVRN